MKPYPYDRRDEHGSIQLHLGEETPRVRADEKLVPLYSAEQVVDLVVELLAENVAVKEIIDSVTDLGNEPQFHEQGMGCGLEDRGITDRYEAMRYGWDQAMERVYGEVIPCAEELSFPATDAFLSRLRAEGVEMFASSLKCSGGVEHPYSTVAMHFARRLREGKAVEVVSD